MEKSEATEKSETMDERARCEALDTLRKIKNQKDALYEELSPRGEVKKFQWALGVLIKCVEKKKLTQQQFNNLVSQVQAIDPFVLVAIGEHFILVARDY